MNARKPKVLISDVDVGSIMDSGKQHCAVCQKGVGSSAISRMCVFGKLVEQNSNGVSDRLQDTVVLVCAVCRKYRAFQTRKKQLDIVDALSLKYLKSFNT